jgi:hypothetical protein
MEAPGNPQQQAVGTSSAPPAPGIPSDHDGGTPATPRHTTAVDPIMSRPPKRRLLLEADATEATATGTLLELKETLIEQARDELRDAMQSMTRCMEAAFKEYRQAEEERWEGERKKMEEFWRAELRKMLGAMQEGTAGRTGGGMAGRTGGGPEVLEATDPTALAEGSDEMEVTPTGRRTQLEFSKHAVNVHDRHDRDKTPAVNARDRRDRDKTPAVQTKNISKHALADPGNDRPSETPKASRPAGTPKEAAAPAPPPTERQTAKPTPGLGAVRSLNPTYAQAASVPTQNTTTKEAGWNAIGPKGKVQKQSAGDDWNAIGPKGKVQKQSAGDDWLLPLKERGNPEDDRKIIFPRDGVTPHPGGNVRAILSEINRALLKASVPDHIRLWDLHRNAKGVLTAITRKESNARQFLFFKDMILMAARKVDPGIINVQSNETWAKLKIHGVPLDQYGPHMDAHGLQTLREDIEAENPGVVIPVALRWVGSPRRIMERYDLGEIRGATVMFAVQDKQAAERLLSTGLRAAGRSYRVERYAIEGPDSMCAKCSAWGHIAEKCDSEVYRCMYCAGNHPTSQHTCGMPDLCKAPKGKLCKFTTEKGANCSGKHNASSAECTHKQTAIREARAQRNSTPSGEEQTSAAPSHSEASYDDSDGDRVMATADEPQL